MQNCFIFGSRSITVLPTAVITAINDVIRNDDFILIGDCYGADKTVQEYLWQKDFRGVTVYHVGKSPRHNVGYWDHIQVFTNGETGRAYYTVKDRALCNDCDYAIAIYDGFGNGTLRNIKELKELGKSVRIYRADLGGWEGE